MDGNVQLYDKLLQLPLFQGMSHDDLTLVVGHTKIGFHKLSAGRLLVKDGDICDQLYCLMSGALTVETIADDRSYTFEETLSAPDLIQPERLFGLTQRFTHTYTTKTDCCLIALDKAETTKLIDQFIIFRLNLMNRIATNLQRAERRPWRRQPSDLRGRIIRFFEMHSLRPAGEKRITIKMIQLAHELNDSRLNISIVLNALQAENLLTLYRGRIHIPALEHLLM